ncbi:unnamed protein product, partial [Rangifer tarandus platyrhynchus]
WGPMLVLSHLPPDSRHSAIPTPQHMESRGKACPISCDPCQPTAHPAGGEGPVNRWASGPSQSSLPFSQQQRAIPCLTSSQRG